MPRPSLREEKKRRTVSISLPPEILALAEEASNKSQFFERAVESCQGILALMNDLRDGKIKRADALEEIEDIVDAWDALRDETMPLEIKGKKRA